MKKILLILSLIFVQNLYSDDSKVILDPIFFGNLETVRALVENGANPNQTDNMGWTPLMYNCLGDMERDPDAYQEQEDLKVIKYLIENGADIYAKNDNGNIAMLIAVLSGRLETVKFFLEQGVPVDYRGEYNTTALIYAASRGHFEIVKYLLEKGANINAATDGGRTALIEAIDYDSFGLVQYLVEKGANVNAKIEGSNWTPIVFAVLEGKLDVIKFLVANGADVNVIDCYGKTALSYAKILNRKEANYDKEIVPYLLSIGAERHPLKELKEYLF